MDWRCRLLFVGLVAVATAWAGCTDPNACDGDSDCFEGQFCAAGTCVERPGGGADGDEGGPDPRDAGDEDSAMVADTDEPVDRDTREDDRDTGEPGDTAVQDGGQPEDVALPDGGSYEFVDVAAGYRHGCGLLNDGRVYCWGSPDFASQSVTSGKRFESIQAGATVTCGRTTSDELVCWGWRREEPYGSSGPPGSLEQGAHYDVGESSGGGYPFVCAQPTAGASHAKCYGWPGSDKLSLSESGQLRDVCGGLDYACVASDFGVTCDAPASFPPGSSMERQSLSDTVQLACSADYACALNQSGQVTCLGEYTEIGEDLEPPSGTYDMLVSGHRYACARDSSTRKVTCWGAEGRPAADQANVPDRPVSALAAGESHACAIADGRIVCWGNSTLDRTNAPSPRRAAQLLGNE